MKTNKKNKNKKCLTHINEDKKTNKKTRTKKCLTHTNEDKKTNKKQEQNTITKINRKEKNRKSIPVLV
jgi:hypothetical protein